MRKFTVLGLVVAALALASCGVQASLNQAINSLGASASLQVHLTASASGPGTAAAQRVLNDVSIDLNFTNPSGAALSQAATSANSEFVFNVNGQAVIDVRGVDGNGYVMVDLTALSSLPGVNLPSSDLSALELLFGGRWFEVPKGLLSSELPLSATQKSDGAKERALAQQVINALSGLINATKYTTLPGGGYEQTGTLDSVMKALWPTLRGLGSSVATAPKSVPGTYHFTLTTNASNATGATLSITAPKGTLGDVTVSLTSTLAHASDAVTAPTDATLITKSMLKDLLSQASAAMAKASAAPSVASYTSSASTLP